MVTTGTAFTSSATLPCVCENCREEEERKEEKQEEEEEEEEETEEEPRLTWVATHLPEDFFMKLSNGRLK
ncbi:hypothetical protein D8674_006618 [Pyrus ussuriensis x Pyrus communis]|uniref:Uncharacterized protein n=1 Tax=Pyrus ussuriensis x Pyrus communis TaxID=2448454 RepID=A0A5N5FZ96_9ROSA|nr:hypothetical protein D8674_006618 [Pyrus ussuriensis x Pyrus communis]